MQTMIEKIARAMADFACINYQHNEEIYKAYARAALLALSEPTESMIDAAPNWDCEQCDGLGYSLTKEIFQKMIQAALDNK